MTVVIQDPVVKESLHSMAEAQQQSVENIVLAILASGLGLQEVVSRVFPVRPREAAAA